MNWFNWFVTSFSWVLFRIHVVYVCIRGGFYQWWVCGHCRASLGDSSVHWASLGLNFLYYVSIINSFREARVQIGGFSSSFSPTHYAALHFAALNSDLNAFAPGEEIFSFFLSLFGKKERETPLRREGYYCFNPLTGSQFGTGGFQRLKFYRPADGWTAEQSCEIKKTWNSTLIIL